MKNRKEIRLGTKSINTLGSTMEVVEYNNAKDIVVKFEQGNTVRTSWFFFERGNVRNVYDKSVYDVGFIGEGIYPCNNKTPQYNTWNAMMARCYSDSHKKRFPTYIGCSVAEYWHNYQNFAKWYDENHYQVDNEKMCLDKDILIVGNKVYSPETCIFVPERINLLFEKTDKVKGVTLDRRRNKYRACYHNGTKIVYLGEYLTPEEAFSVYKDHKVRYIKEVAEMYKTKIPDKLYNALVNYSLEIEEEM